MFSTVDVGLFVLDEWSFDSVLIASLLATLTYLLNSTTPDGVRTFQVKKLHW